MKVLKFGGSSVGSPERILEVKKIVEKQDENCIVVVSAFQGVTDQLVEICRQAPLHNNIYQEQFRQLCDRHKDVVKSLIAENRRETVLRTLTELLQDLEDVLHGLFLLRDLTPKTSDYILSFGERLSALIISNVIENVSYADPGEFIRTDSAFGKAKVDFNLTDGLISKHFAHPSKCTIIPGFIGRNAQGETTTLGRGGSDYTAAIIAAALDASVLEIWTDVDGFMTADPKKVEKAFAIRNLSYSEAMELSHFGAKVVYTPTIQPVFKKNIPVKVLNSFNPDAPGTVICSSDLNHTDSPIKGISSIDNISLITLVGAGLVGVTGISSRLFSSLAKNSVNVILITQASSEYSITFAVNPADTRKAIKAIKNEFEAEIDYKKEITILLEENLSIIAIVGEKMKNTPGISANLFTSLGRSGISVIATAQGSSELNISVVIKNIYLKKALNVIHDGFFLSKYKDLHLFLIGIGTVGKSLLRQIENQQEKLLHSHKLKINLVGISNSRKMLLNEGGIDLHNYLDRLNEEGVKANINEFVAKMAAMNIRNSVFIDCTANEDVAKLYNKVLDSYISIVAANKIACSSEYSLYKELKTKARDKNIKFIFETNVGAGLPIISTINDLIKSGDKIIKIEAVLSGTLNFVFNVLSADVPLSEAVRMAKEKGFSEPDPRIDLSGIDVVRKILILSREAGYEIEKKDVEIHTFLPKECFEGPVEDFWKKLPHYDEEFENKRKKLEASNKCWRFVAKLEDGKASVELMEVGQNHPAYHLEGSNNIILITTERYKEQPMIIKGYGAGAEVTAAGVFADIIRVANV